MRPMLSNYNRSRYRFRRRKSTVQQRHRHSYWYRFEDERGSFSLHELGDPTRPISPQHLSEDAFRVEEHNLLHRLNFSIAGDFGLSVEGAGTGRKYLDDQKRIADQPIASARRFAGNREIGDVAGIVAIGAGNTCFAKNT